MRSIYYISILTSLLLLFSNCEEDEVVNSPANPANPSGSINYLITDCDTMQVDITFSGTNLFNEDNGQYFSIDSTQYMCNKYPDQALMIANGMTYLDLLTGSLIPPTFGSKAELKYSSSDPTNPTLEITLTNNDYTTSGIGHDGFSLHVDIPDIFSAVSIGQDIHDTLQYYVSDQMIYNEFYGTIYKTTFSQIDVVNKKFEGNIDITFIKKISHTDPVTQTIVYFDYPPLTTFPFYASVYFKFIVED